MNCPPFLKKGDKIAIVAPARKISSEELEPALAFIQSNGWQAVFSDTMLGEYHQWSGTDEQRKTDLQRYLDDESIRMIWCARGGYGSMRIVDNLDWTKFNVSPKWLVGFSDITVFLQTIVHQNQCNVIHGPVCITIKNDESAAQRLVDLLSGKIEDFSISPHPLNRNGVASGILHGGNLSLLYALQSSSQDNFPEGSILFLEDLDEYLYHIDRMMVSLKRSGKLAKLGALLVGGMSDMRDNSIPFGFSAQEIIANAVKEYQYPVCFNFPAGHIAANHPIMFGKLVRISVENSICTLSYSDGNTQ